MKQLIQFSLKRRFLTKTSLVLQVLMFGILFSVINLDRISNLFKLNLDRNIQISTDESTMKQLLPLELWNTYGFELISVEQSKLGIKINDTGYLISSEYPIDLLIQAKLQQILLTLHQREYLNEHHESVGEMISYYENINITYDVQHSVQLSQTKQNMIFMVITSIYFMMLNFAAVTSNEVILEKTSNLLEIILTSVSTSTHFISKLIVGWLSILIQAMITGGFAVILLWQRNNSDLGKGLLQLIAHFSLIPSDIVSFHGLIAYLEIDKQTIVTFIFGCGFLLLGILLVQTVLVIASSRVKTMEEAGSIQGPCYILLLLMYYLTLSQNSVAKLSSGLGYLLSFVPFFSMLFMPARLLLQPVITEEILLSAFFAVSVLAIVLVFGRPIYQQGVLNEKKAKRELVKFRTNVDKV